MLNVGHVLFDTRSYDVHLRHWCIICDAIALMAPNNDRVLIPPSHGIVCIHRIFDTATNDTPATLMISSNFTCLAIEKLVQSRDRHVEAWVILYDRAVDEECEVR